VKKSEQAEGLRLGLHLQCNCVGWSFAMNMDKLVGLRLLNGTKPCPVV
jgi:hypothetical protein